MEARFWLETSKLAGNVCFKETQACAHEFIKTVVEPNIFDLNETHQVSFQMFGYDFAFTQAKQSYENSEIVLNNMKPYLPAGS